MKNEIPEYKIYHIKNNLSDFVSINTNASNVNNLFLIDTEASVSLIKISSISQQISYDKSEIIKLVGIAKNPIFSLGSFNMKIVEQNVEFEHKFHLVSDDFLIPSNGIIGKDFIKRFKCLIDYGEMTFTIRKPNIAPIILPIKSELINGVSALPARCETFRIFHIKSNKFPCLIEAQEIEENIVVPTTIVHQPQACIRVLNTNDEIKVINTENLKQSHIEDFHILKPEKSQTYTNDRLKNLQNKLKKKVPEFMRNKLLDLCIDFADIFHVDGDNATVNNFYEQKLMTSDNEPVFTKNYRLPYAQKNEINNQIKTLLENDLIELSTSPYNSPLIIKAN